ncbi:MAG: C45 family peptidase [Verrucomicrobiota bacterium]
MSTPESHASPPPLYRWAGSAQDIGRQHGLAFASEIRREAVREAGRLAALMGGSESAALERFWELHRGIYETWLPESIEEICGLGEGAEISFLEAFLVATAARANLRMSDACSSIFVPRQCSLTGGALIGQTKDTPRHPSEHLGIHKIFSSGREEILLTYAGWTGNIGINSHGLGFCANSLPAEHRGNPNTLSAGVLWRLIHETGDLDLVLDTARRFPFANGSVFIGHATEGCRIVEFVHGEMNVIEVPDSPCARANTVLSPHLKKWQTDSDAVARFNLRQNRMDALLKKQPAFSFDDIHGILQDHEHHPLSVCRHDSELDHNVTTGGFVADLAAGRIRFWASHTCLNLVREAQMEQPVHSF